MDNLKIINDALIGTGNLTINLPYDGTDEWLAGNSAYERAVDDLLSRHKWGFATAFTPLAGRLPECPHPSFSDAFQLPSDCISVQSVFIGRNPLTEYEVVGGSICCNVESGLTIKYVRSPDPDRWPAIFVSLVTMLVEANLYRSLNEDLGAASERERTVEMKLAEARSLTDAENPPQRMFRSRTAERRRGGANRTIRGGFPYNGVP